MSQSENISELVAALLKAQADIGHANKNATGQIGQQRGYQYANLESVIDTVREAFTKNDLVVMQPTDIIPGVGPVVTTVVAHKSGQYIKGHTPIINAKGDAQGMGSAITYARRYGLAAIANITQQDDDGLSASAGPARTAVKKATPTPKPNGRPSEEF